MPQSPLNQAHLDLGAKLVPFGGWDMPLAYPSGTIAEHLACRNDATVFDVSHLGTVRIEGPDALARLQGALTNDLNKIAPGRAQYTHLLDEKDGSVVDDIIVWWRDQEVFDVMPNASNTANVRDAIGGEDVTSTRAILAVQGPNARDKVRSFFPTAADVPHFGVITADWQGTPVTVAGTGYTGEDGLEIAVPVAAAPSLWAAILNAGVTPAGLGARDTLRLEAGLPLYGHELAPGITTLDAGLGWVVGWKKEAFRGRDALLAQKERGVSRQLVGLVGESRRPFREHSAIEVAGARVGETTSGNFSPVLERGVAMAFVTNDVHTGDIVHVVGRGEPSPAEVVSLPIVKRGG